MGNTPSCVNEVSACVNDGEQLICTCDGTGGNINGPAQVVRADPDPFLLSREDSGLPHMTPYDSSAPRLAPIVLPTIHVDIHGRSSGALPDGRTYTSSATNGALAQRAGDIQSTINGLLEGLRGAFTGPPASDRGNGFGVHPQGFDGSMVAQMPYHHPSHTANLTSTMSFNVPMITRSSGSIPRSQSSVTTSSTHAKFCDQCGASCTETSKFCAGCGAKLSEVVRLEREDTDRSFSARSGVVLGTGSWGEAYRQASGTRRDALRMLAMTGIVTERELGDDNTKVANDHIEECISIATEMLFKWPPNLGTPPLHEAGAFFEQRLTQRHMSRRPDYGTCGLNSSSGHFNSLSAPRPDYSTCGLNSSSGQFNSLRARPDYGTCGLNSSSGHFN